MNRTKAIKVAEFFRCKMPIVSIIIYAIYERLLSRENLQLRQRNQQLRQRRNELLEKTSERLSDRTSIEFRFVSAALRSQGLNSIEEINKFCSFVDAGCYESAMKQDLRILDCIDKFKREIDRREASQEPKNDHCS